jgi:excisionase family DNA binding protein
MTTEEFTLTISKIVKKALNEAQSSTRDNRDEADDLLNVTQASKLLNISVQTLYTKSSKGELPTMKRGKRLYFSKSELIQYIKAGKKMTQEDIENMANAYLQSTQTGAKKR